MFDDGNLEAMFVSTRELGRVILVIYSTRRYNLQIKIS